MVSYEIVCYCNMEVGRMLKDIQLVLKINLVGNR